MAKACTELLYSRQYVIFQNANFSMHFAELTLLLMKTFRFSGESSVRTVHLATTS